MRRRYSRSIRVLTCALFLFVTSAHAEEKHKWYGNFSVRQTLDPKFVYKPAFATIIAQADTRPIYVVGAAIKYNLPSPSSHLELTPGVEWQRNTTISKEQDLFKAGVKADLNLWDIGDRGTHRWTPIIVGQLEYKRDKPRDIDALQASISTTLIFQAPEPGITRSLLPNILGANSTLAFLYSPSFGIEYASEGADSGGSHVNRVLISVRAELYPFPFALNWRLHFPATYAYRRGSSAEDGSRDHHSFTVSMNIYFIGTSKGGPAVGIGVDFVEGADPSAGFRRQRLWRFGLKAGIS